MGNAPDSPPPRPSVARAAHSRSPFQSSSRRTYGGKNVSITARFSPISAAVSSRLRRESCCCVEGIAFARLWIGQKGSDVGL